MDINKSELKTEKLPDSAKTDYLNVIIEQIETDEKLSQREVNEKLEIVLIERSACHCKQSTNNNEKQRRFKCKCHSIQNRFILGQFYFDSLKYRKAYEVFDAIKDKSYPALYQLGVILYDDLLDLDQQESSEETSSHRNNDSNNEIDTIQTFRHPNRANWEKGFDYMHKIAKSFEIEEARNLIYPAQYNVGKAYYQGFGVKQSDDMAEKWWLLAADNGNPAACVSAMTALAFFYSRKLDPEYFDLKKAYFWHNEACGNGSLESQGALGAMYYFGLGCKQDLEAAYECLTNSSERGNVYAMGLLCDYYYRNKFYVKAADLCKKVLVVYDIQKISRETNCVKSFVAKGIALACFIYARCLEKGKGTESDPELAKKLYKRSYHFDPDLCQLFQNFSTHEKI